MKKFIKNNIIFFLVASSGFSVFSQENTILREEFDQWSLLERDTIEYNMTDLIFRWKVKSPDTDLDYYCFTTNKHKETGLLDDNISPADKNFIILNTKDLSTVETQSFTGGISQIVIGCNTKPLGVYVNGDSLGTYLGNNSDNPIIVDYIDSEGDNVVKITAPFGGATNPKIYWMMIYGWTPAKITDAKTSEDGNSIKLNFSEALNYKDTTIYDSSHGFSLNLPNSENEIDNIYFGNDGLSANIYLKTITYRHHEIQLNYDRSVGEILSELENSLKSYTKLDIINNSPILPPEIIQPALTNSAGDLIYVPFDKKMQDTIIYSDAGFSVSSSVSGDISIYSVGRSDTDPFTLEIALNASFNASDEIELSYTGDIILSDEGGYLQSFQAFPIVNLMYGANAELLVNPETDLLGNYLILSFSKELNTLPSGELDAFVVKVNGEEVTLTTMDLDSLDASIMYLHLSEAVNNTQDLTLSFKGGSFSTLEGAGIRVFENKPVINNSPGIPPAPLVSFTDLYGKIITVEFEFDLGKATVNEVLSGDFIAEITRADTVLYDTLSNVKVPTYIDENNRLQYYLNKLEILFTHVIEYTDDLRLIYEGSELQGFDRGIVLPFNITLHNNMAGADAKPVKSHMTDDHSSIIIGFSRELDINYTFSLSELLSSGSYRVNIDPADFTVRINNGETESPDFLPGSSSLVTFISRRFTDPNSLIVNMDLDYYKYNEWDSVVVQSNVGTIYYDYGDIVKTFDVTIDADEDGEFSWGNNEIISGYFIPDSGSNLIKVDSGMVSWNYNGIDYFEEVNIIDDYLDVILTVDNEIIVEDQIYIAPDSFSVAWNYGDSITAEFNSFTNIKGTAYWIYNDSTIINKTLRISTQDAYPVMWDSTTIQGLFVAEFNTSYFPVDSTKVEWKEGDEIVLDYKQGRVPIKTISEPYDEILLHDTLMMITTQPEIDTISNTIIRPYEFAGASFVDSSSAYINGQIFYMLSIEFETIEQGYRSGVVEDFTLTFEVPFLAEDIEEESLKKDSDDVAEEEGLKKSEADDPDICPLISPVSDYFIINNADNFKKIKVLDITGNVLIDTNLNSSWMEIPAYNFYKGIYIIILQGSDERESFVGKVLKY